MSQDSHKTEAGMSDKQADEKFGQVTTEKQDPRTNGDMQADVFLAESKKILLGYN